MIKIKAVFFDLDGTLVDTFESIVISFNEALKALGAGPVDREILVESIGAPHDVTLRKIVPGASREELNEATSVFRKTRAEITDKYTKVLPGVPELLKNLKSKNIKTGVVTTTTRQMTEHILKAANLYDFFDVLITRDDVKNLKPDPEPIINAIDKLNLNKDECIMVGDHPNDIISAKTASVKVAAIPNVYDKKTLEKYKPDYIFKNIIDVESVIL
jgi:pyrophosphatase PpaX